MFTLAIKSLLNRKFTTLMTILSIALSVTLLLGVERIRVQTRKSFTKTISGADLIVGARSGPVQLLLYSVFRIGNATNNISWQSYQKISKNPNVEWTIPISLGDSHKGYRVVGTNADYFKHFRYADKRKLGLSGGEFFDDVFSAVVGAEVAKTLKYKIGDEIVLTCGVGAEDGAQHTDKPFTVVGILKPTATPVDQSVHIPLQGMTAIHIDWQGGAPMPGLSIDKETVKTMDLTPKSITAFIVGLKSRVAAFKVQREVNEYSSEALLAIFPGVALQELWDLLSIAEKALMAVSVFVVVVGMMGMLIALMTSLNERRREMAVLRSVGASPRHIFGLIVGESTLLTFMGIIVGIILLYCSFLIARPLILSRVGLHLQLSALSSYEYLLCIIVCVAGVLIGLFPGYKIYRYSLADGMMARL